MDLSSLQGEKSVHSLFRRCVQCPNLTPACPACPKGQTCSLSIQSCDECPSTSCIGSAAEQQSGSGASSAAPVPAEKHANAGAIAGGVIGGVAFIALVTYLVYRFVIKNRRQEYEEEDEWTEEREAAEKAEHFGHRRDDRASTHTVGSIASTVLTRASNVIQIAYIPGVTNRSPPSTPGLNVPPVPPLPFGSGSNSTASTPSYQQDQHFFMPDFRDSTYSQNGTGHQPRDSVAPSLGRSSVATSVYRSNAVVDAAPAQTGIRGKAAVVSVKSSNQNSPTGSRPPTPPMPALDHERYGLRRAAADEAMRGPPSPAFSVGSTFLNGTANTAKAVTARPVMVGKSPKSFSPSGGEGAAPAAANAYRDVLPRLSVATSHTSFSRHSRARRNEKTRSVFDDVSSDDEEPGSRARQSLRVGEVEAEAGPSPFSDRMATASPTVPARSLARSPPDPSRPSPANNAAPVGKSTGVGHKHSGSLSQAIEEATRRASRHPTHGGLGGVQREASPFSDANELK
ncbi:MAG: hypothetical protein M1832_006377 [Thelocarpon impressellum]|nr:MAG: hypothetical protein M1832_006377 [Thelocarpon impressellum]